mmetsp:Transcript_75686/g.245190  ORF Transcript_75686/g.245190 Transcript_75686/m.245190 type:complete len:92 (-) Transcript_75686:690-965(-)
MSDEGRSPELLPYEKAHPRCPKAVEPLPRPGPIDSKDPTEDRQSERQQGICMAAVWPTFHMVARRTRGGGAPWKAGEGGEERGRGGAEDED